MWDLMNKEPFAVSEERCKNRLEVLVADITTFVLVLGDVGLSNMIPNLKKMSNHLE